MRRWGRSSPTIYKRICLNFLHSQVGRDAITLTMSACASTCAQEPPLWNFLLPPTNKVAGRYYFHGRLSFCSHASWGRSHGRVLPFWDSGVFFTKVITAYLLLIHNIWTIKLFVNRGQIRPLNSKSTDLDWRYSKLFWETEIAYLWLIIHDFCGKPPWYSPLLLTSGGHHLETCSNLFTWGPTTLPGTDT